MADAVILTSKKDLTKANPRKYEDYTVQFPPSLEKYNGRITVKFKHVDAQVISSCYMTNGDGESYLSDFQLFRKCVKEVHGLKQLVINKDGTEEYVEMTPEEILHFEEIRAESEDGDNAMQIIFTIVHDTAQAIILKSILTEEEIKNLEKGVKPSSQDSSEEKRT